MEKYNIGLDIGTTSVGWAVVNKEKNTIMRKGNKKLWGVRLFEEASTAENRRKQRSQRRRYARRKERINLLRKEFSDEINKVDNNFYTKLEESFYNKKDEKKTIKLTPKEKALIKEYNKKYPTIYHLREELINNKEQQDIRLVYLAIHHIIKYRGDFLYKGDFNSNNLNIKEALTTIMSLMNNYQIINIEDIETLSYKEIELALLNESKRDKKEALTKILSTIFPKEVCNEFIKFIMGNKTSINKLLAMDIEKNLELNIEKYDEKIDDLSSDIGDKIEILDAIKQLYDILILKRFFKDENTSISSVMVKKYKTHKQDLRNLKDLFLSNENLYNEIFKSTDNLCLYEKYIKGQLSYDEFTKELKSKFEILFEELANNQLKDKYLIEIQPKIDSGNFMPRITETNNSIYPFQLNKTELIQIIENQGRFYKFLLDKTNDGIYKLVKILEFKIPYYVGPLNDTTSSKNTKNKNSWMERKQNNVKITPYNFSEIVDLESSAEKFITRMTSNCTYLLTEPAMPSNSILYSKYKVLNELKQITINDMKLTEDFQNRIYKELFLKTKGTITNTIFTNFVYEKKEFDMFKDNLLVKGYSADNKFANNMQSYHDFFGENGIFEGTSYTIDDAEEIIKWITIFEDKDILEKKVKNNYNLSNDSIKKILSKKYKGWSNLSKTLLTTKYYVDPYTNIKKSILDLMEETPQNFMQIIFNDKYNFQKMIADFNKVNPNHKINYELVSDLATSPATKKGIYQALKVVEEIVDYMGYEPNGIMIEMARNDDKKERKQDRKKYLQNLYDSAKNDIENYPLLKSQLNDTKEITLKLYLYFLQEGKSLYSQQPIEIERLNECEIDHILPRTLYNDNSLDNKALVFKHENQEKAASFILPKRFRTEERKSWWNHLKNLKLISAKKYNRLIRDKYTDSDIEGFINRQLVETRQISKHVANILNNYYSKTKVTYLHANLSHDYREKFELFKYRDLNDYHHAHDAYLAAVLGEYKNTYLKTINYDKIKELNHKLYENKEYKKLNYGYVINSLDKQFINYYNTTGEIVFDPSQFNKIVADTLYCNDILISKKTEIRTGAFYQETKNSHKNVGKNDVPLKKGLAMEDYGSYTEIKPSYLDLIKYGKKQKLIGIPILIKEQAKKDSSILDSYIRKQLKLSENESYEILIAKIPFQQLIDYKGQLTYITGSTCELVSAVQLHIEKNLAIKWKYTLNKILNEKEIPLNENKELVLNEADEEVQTDEIISYLIKKLHKYYPLYENLANKFEEYLQTNSLNLKGKEKFAKELFKLLNGKNANLKDITSGKLTNRLGRLNGQNITSGTLYYNSVTGLRSYKREF